MGRFPRDWRRRTGALEIGNGPVFGSGSAARHDDAGGHHPGMSRESAALAFYAHAKRGGNMPAAQHQARGKSLNQTSILPSEAAHDGGDRAGNAASPDIRARIGRPPLFATRETSADPERQHSDQHPAGPQSGGRLKKYEFFSYRKPQNSALLASIAASAVRNCPLRSNFRTHPVP